MLRVKLPSLSAGIFRREFEIKEQIGEPEPKDKLTYQLLISQIEAGLNNEVTICPAAGQCFEKTICPAVFSAHVRQLYCACHEQTSYI